MTDDDHTQYRLESVDHSHQTTGAEAGKLDHGLALNGLTDDDHTQYLKEEASGGAASEVPDHTHASAAEAGATLSPTTLTLPTSANPTPTAEGSITWDSDDDTMIVGTGAAGKEFGYLGTTSPADTGTTAAGTSKEVSHVDHVHNLESHGATDHTNVTRYVFVSPQDMQYDDASLSTLGTTPDLVGVALFTEAGGRTGAFFSILVPGDWASTTAIQPVLIWRTTSSTGDVRWLISVSELAAGDSPGEASDLLAASGTTIADGTTVKYSNLPTFTPATAGNVLKVNLERNASGAADTATGGANVLGVRFEYTATQ